MIMEHETVLIRFMGSQLSFSVSSGLPKDELQTAIELSLQESHNAQEEEREFHRYEKTVSAHLLLTGKEKSMG